MSADWPPVVTIVGPTAVGKSRLALQLAEEFGGEIVSADSRQVYRYMDIGTDKASLEQRARVSHHLIDVVAPDDTYSAQRFREEGTRVLRRLAARGRLALVVGGTGFYIRALLDRPSVPEVPPNPEYRAELAREAEISGAEALHRRLRQVDPASADRIHPNNLPRVIRAIEIVHVTGRPVPELERREPVPSLYVGLTRPRRQLWEIAGRRALAQVRSGLPEETRLLLEMGYEAELPSMQGFGYRQMVAYLRGEMTLAGAIKGYQLAQRQFIRRQMTWFGRDERIVWLDVGEGDVYDRAREMVKEWVQ